MKLSLTFTSLLLSSLVAAKSGSFFSNSQKVLGDGGAVPGENPLTFCQADHSKDLLTLEKVNLSPNPPKAGQTLTIEALGDLKEDVEEGAKVILTVKYGFIKLVNTEADLCKQVSNVDLECPVKKGPVKITKDVELPNEIPPGKYTVYAEAVTKDGKPITCLEATVTFSRD